MQTEATSNTSYVLNLTRKAIDEFDEVSLEISARRAMRIASLLGESKFAVRMSLELTPLTENPEINSENLKSLLSDPSTYSTANGPASLSLKEYLADRTVAVRADKKETFLIHSIPELEKWLSHSMINDGKDAKAVKLQHEMQQVIWRLRSRIYTSLCNWERQITYTGVNERIFVTFRDRVDGILAVNLPSVLDQFTAAYKRLREVAFSAPEADVSEELAQALTSCRRILEAVVDYVYPPIPGDPNLNEEKHNSRAREFVKSKASGSKHQDFVTASIDGLDKRYARLNGLANKGLHAKVALEEAELCAINTYVIAGEMVRLSISPNRGS
ncbi:hypothetical protein HRW09_02385 [Streptomyces lunaelactis]|uniref:hypothetical protein n=1 Tax=Streptomyces lunaelactis TaxID=1535768 RepID=UPI0015856996|nr:hypothetical protein [Streptomyces lunaelactis]NUL28435.1 hypothetical protein [Streptomyces lunaelactis]